MILESEYRMIDHYQAFELFYQYEPQNSSFVSL